MRRQPTRSEDRLWSWLRDHRFGGHKFRRQHPIGPYVLDFYCAELRLAVEVDGRHHETAWVSEADGARTLDLQAHGITVVRIPNELLTRDYLSAIDCVRVAIERLEKR
jgi:very-short-patch-repair endonuclease